MFRIKDKDISIFIVDDDELLIKILTTKFRQNTSYNIHTFPTGEAFLEFYKSQTKTFKRQFHILIIDYMLKPHEPVHSTKNGIDYFKEAQALNPRLKPILISALDNPEISVQASNAGINTFIKKNENAFLRINNQINFIISEIQLEVAHKRSLITRQIFISLLIIFILLATYFFIINSFNS